MKNKCSPIKNLNYNNNNFFKKIELNKNLKSHSRKNIFTQRDTKTYNEILSTNKKNNNFLHDLPKENVTQKKNKNVLNIIRHEKNKIPKKLNTSGNESARFLSGTPKNFQQILTEISNMNNNSENYNPDKSSNINNESDYYKNLYQREKNINSKLLIKINDLSHKNINYERILSKYKIERHNLIEKIKELGKIINHQRSNSNQINTANKNEKINDFSLLNDERNKIIMKNQQLKNSIKKILKDNNELKMKIQSIEKNSFDISNNKIRNTKNYININNKNCFHPLIKNNSFIQKNSAYNKSFRLISNLSLYRNNSKKSLSKNKNHFQNNSNNINNNVQSLKNIEGINDYYNDDDNKTKILKVLKNESRKKDSYINDLELEQKQNQNTLKKVIKENNNLLEQINILKKELNNKNSEIIKLKDIKTNVNMNKYNALIQEIMKLKNDINILNNQNEEKEKKLNENNKKINLVEIENLKLKQKIIEINDKNQGEKKK